MADELTPGFCEQLRHFACYILPFRLGFPFLGLHVAYFGAVHFPSGEHLFVILGCALQIEIV